MYFLCNTCDIDEVGAYFLCNTCDIDEVGCTFYVILVIWMRCGGLSM